MLGGKGLVLSAIPVWSILVSTDRAFTYCICILTAQKLPSRRAGADFAGAGADFGGIGADFGGLGTIFSPRSRIETC